jgi:fatty-acyl-CoA synthase
MAGTWACADITSEDRVWLGSPLFYGLGATNALPVTITRGATLVLQGAFEAGKAIDVIERTQSTVYYATGI